MPKMTPNGYFFIYMFMKYLRLFVFLHMEGSIALRIECKRRRNRPARSLEYQSSMSISAAGFTSASCLSNLQIVFRAFLRSANRALLVALALVNWTSRRLILWFNALIGVAAGISHEFWQTNTPKYWCVGSDWILAKICDPNTLC